MRSRVVALAAILLLSGCANPDISADTYDPLPRATAPVTTAAPPSQAVQQPPIATAQATSAPPPAESVPPVAPAPASPPAPPSQEAPPPPSSTNVGSSLTLHGYGAGAQIDVAVTNVFIGANPANDYSHPKAGHRWIAVELRITNSGQAIYDEYPGNDSHLIDAEGQQYDDTFEDIKEGVNLREVTITPGDARKGVLVYEIPETAKPVKFQMAWDSVFGNAPGEWIIGQP